MAELKKDLENCSFIYEDGKLFFKKDDIPGVPKKELENCSVISKDGELFVKKDDITETQHNRDEKDKGLNTETHKNNTRDKGDRERCNKLVDTNQQEKTNKEDATTKQDNGRGSTN